MKINNVFQITVCVLESVVEPSRRGHLVPLRSEDEMQGRIVEVHGITVVPSKP